MQFINIIHNKKILNFDFFDNIYSFINNVL